MKSASDWELALYELNVVNEAIRNYDTYSRDYRDVAERGYTDSGE